MGFHSGAIAKIWATKPSPSGKSIVAEMSTSKKKQDGGYETDWSNKFVLLAGKAAKEAESLADGATVKIGDCDVTSRWDSEKRIMYTNYVIFSFQSESNDKAKEEPKKPDSSFVNVPDGDEEELPFN